MIEDLARSDRPTARGVRFRPRSRLAPGPLRPASLRQPAPGIARGMITGALLAIGVLTAFTLPFLRDGSGPAPAAPTRQAASTGERSEPPLAEVPAGTPPRQEAGMLQTGLSASSAGPAHAAASTDP